MYIHRNLINFPLFLSLNMYIHITYASVSYVATFAVSTDHRTDLCLVSGLGRCSCLLRWWNDSMMPDWRLGVMGYNRIGGVSKPHRGFRNNDWRSTWERNIKKWNVKLKISENLPFDVFVGWRSWWFLYWNDGSPGNPWIFLGRHDTGWSFTEGNWQFSWIGGSGSRRLSWWFRSSKDSKYILDSCRIKQWVLSKNLSGIRRSTEKSGKKITGPQC